jgi:hypothetical protein
MLLSQLRYKVPTIQIYLFHPRVICPSGYYCPEGATKPIPCTYLMACAPGTSKMQFNAVGVIAVSVLFLVWGIFQIAVNWRRYNIFKSCASKNNKEVMLEGIEDDENEEEEAVVGAVHPLDLAFSSISVPPAFEFQNSRIYQANGSIPAGKLTAIMGASGCGKVLLYSPLSFLFFSLFVLFLYMFSLYSLYRFNIAHSPLLVHHLKSYYRS